MTPMDLRHRELKIDTEAEGEEDSESEGELEQLFTGVQEVLEAESSRLGKLQTCRIKVASLRVP